MRYNWRNNSVLFVHNLSSEPREVHFALKIEDGEDCILANLLSDDHSRSEKGFHHYILIEPYGYRWYRVCGLDYLLKRSDA
jgi:maltose alpha-D-glucosyltransferase/alpha-amylase